MKIATISKIKNEADIIESFVRYHAGIVDEMFFVENGSMDGTVQILHFLKEEGYPITIFDEADSEFDELRFINQYVDLVLETEQLDWLIPIDADEFLYADGNNPKIYMEKWDKEAVYMVMWRTYIWNTQIEDKEGFIPDRFNVYRDEKYEQFKKVIVPGQLFARNKLLISHGNHDVVGIDIKKKNDSVVKFAHYPVRCMEQFKAQIVVNAISQMSRHYRKKTEAWHWENIYKLIRENRELNLEKISMTYAMDEVESKNGKDIQACAGSMKHDFMNEINLRYEQYVDISAFNNLMYFCETLAKKYAQNYIKDLEYIPDQRKKIVIFGVGNIAEVFVDAINKSKYEIVAYADSNTNGSDRTFREERVYNISDVIGMEIDYIVIASGLYFKEMKRKLLSLGFSGEICFITEILKKGWMEESGKDDKSGY